MLDMLRQLNHLLVVLFNAGKMSKSQEMKIDAKANKRLGNKS